jgi:hypothetical protein
LLSRVSGGPWVAMPRLGALWRCVATSAPILNSFSRIAPAAANCLCRDRCGAQVGLRFPDTVLHVAARAINVLVEFAWPLLDRLQRGDEPRIGFAIGPFRLVDHAAATRPGFERRIGKLLEPARGFACSPRLRLGLDPLGVDLAETPGFELAAPARTDITGSWRRSSWSLIKEGSASGRRGMGPLSVD